MRYPGLWVQATIVHWKTCESKSEWKSTAKMYPLNVAVCSTSQTCNVQFGFKLLFYFASTNAFDFKNEQTWVWKVLHTLAGLYINVCSSRRPPVPSFLFLPPVEVMSDTPITHSSIDSLENQDNRRGCVTARDKICTQGDESASVATINLPAVMGRIWFLSPLRERYHASEKMKQRHVWGKEASSWEVWACWRGDTWRRWAGRGAAGDVEECGAGMCSRRVSRRRRRRWGGWRLGARKNTFSHSSRACLIVAG